MQIFYTDFDDIFERFAIMTIDGGQTDKEAYNYCKEHTTPELAEKLQEWIKNNPIQQEVPDCYAKNKELEASQRNAEKNNADFETLAKYINAGFEIYPCLYSQKNNCYVHTYYRDDVLHYGLYETEQQKETKERHGITDLETLKTLCTKTIKDEYGRQQKTTLFRIFPTDNKYIVIDIDTHKDKANGLMQWYYYIKKNGLDCVEHFNDLTKFPCYTESANGGKHLYFKFPYTIPNKIKNLASSVEVSGRNHPETAAGSFRTGTKNGFYTLHGDFKNAPLLPFRIYDDIKDEPPEPETRRVRGNWKQAQYNNSALWNQTLEGIANKARQRNTQGNHNFIDLFCKYAEKANADTENQTNYTKSEIESFLFSLPEVIEHERKDKGDTQSCINSHHFN